MPLSFLKKISSYQLGAILGILACHIGLVIAGIGVIDIDYYWQFMDWELLDKDFWGSILYFHANPPGLSLLHLFAKQVSFGHPYIFWALVLPFLHILAWSQFYAFVQRIGFKYAKWVSLILFLNPLIFIYFKYPFYSTFIFTSSCFLLNILFSSKSRDYIFIGITIVFAFNALLRSSWHVFVLGAFLLPLFFKTSWKSRGIALAIFLLPLSIYVKNYVLFEKFTSSTWMGMNLYHHIDRGAEDLSIFHAGRFMPLPAYDGFIQEDHPLVKKYQAVEHLNRGNFNDTRFILVSDAFIEDVKKGFTLKHSIPTLADGYCRFMDSPAHYSFLFEKSDFVEGKAVWLYDWFDLPNPQKGSPHLRKGFSIYLLVYSLSILLSIFLIRKFSFKEMWVIGLCLLLSILYFSIDYVESNRMRFEIEPLWYAWVLFVIMRLFPKRLPANK